MKFRNTRCESVPRCLLGGRESGFSFSLFFFHSFVFSDFFRLFSWRSCFYFFIVRLLSERWCHRRKTTPRDELETFFLGPFDEWRKGVGWSRKKSLKKHHGHSIHFLRSARAKKMIRKVRKGWGFVWTLKIGVVSRKKSRRVFQEWKNVLEGWSEKNIRAEGKKKRFFQALHGCNSFASLGSSHEVFWWDSSLLFVCFSPSNKKNTFPTDFPRENRVARKGEQPNEIKVEWTCDANRQSHLKCPKLTKPKYSPINSWRM